MEYEIELGSLAGKKLNEITQMVIEKLVPLEISPLIRDNPQYGFILGDFVATAAKAATFVGAINAGIKMKINALNDVDDRVSGVEVLFGSAGPGRKGDARLFVDREGMSFSYNDGTEERSILNEKHPELNRESKFKRFGRVDVSFGEDGSIKKTELGTETFEEIYGMIGERTPERRFSHSQTKKIEVFNSDGISTKKEAYALPSDFRKTIRDTMKFEDINEENMLEWSKNARLFYSAIRKQIDVVSIFQSEIDDGTIRFSGDVQINPSFFKISPYVLSDVGVADIPIHSENYTISQMSRVEIDSLLERVKNPKIREGLKKISVGRENYSYDSSVDEHYINTFVEETKGRGR